MSGLTLEQFIALSGGRLECGEIGAAQRFRPATDSRTIEAGETFACLRGPQFDGHDFIGAVLARGAAALVVDAPQKLPRECQVPAVVVTDVKLAYLAGAAAARKLV